MLDTTTTKEYLEAMKRFLKSDASILLLIGEQQSGKTALLSTLVDQMRAAQHIIRLKGSRKSHPTQLVTLFTNHWPIDSKNKDQRLEDQLQNVIKDLQKQNEFCLLVVDDAHLLPLSMLAAICHLAILQENETPNLHIVLSGLPGLSEKICGLQNKPVPQITLGAVSFEKAQQQMQQYLDKKNFLATDQAVGNLIQDIYEKSHGLPNIIQDMMRELTRDEPVHVNHTMKEVDPTKPIKNRQKKQNASLIRATSLVALAVVCAGMWYLGHHQNLTDKLIMAENRPPMPLPEKTIKQEKKRHLNTDKHLAAALSTHEKPSDLIRKLTVSPMRPVIASKDEMSQDIQKQLIQLADTSSNKAANKPAHQAHAPYYTVQLIGSRKKSDIINFIQSNDSQANLVTETLNGKPWYIAAHGNYQSHQEASHALQNLSLALKQRHPWVKKVGSSRL